MSNVINIENLGKRYLIGHRRQERYSTLRDSLASGGRSIAKRLLHPFLASSGQPLPNADETEEFWALRNISLNISQGDRVGIIGRNGAGKSTLLKILSRITEPTEGRVRIKGRVASLLEVGTGFHPELTGRENIFLNGALLGMPKSEIKNKFDEIVAFAETEKFLDTPVKRYSSGMYVRLAFAVAAHLEPEILIVDEVLAVGDADFQKKCLGKMGEVASKGRTVVFVSHNMQAIKRLCNKGFLLDGGQVVESSSADAVVEHYLSRNSDHQFSVEIPPDMHMVYPPNLEIQRIEVLNHKEEKSTDIIMDEPFYLKMSYKLNKPGSKYIISASIRTYDGVLVATSSSVDDLGFLPSSLSENTLLLTMHNVLNPGQYYLEFKVKSSQSTIDMIEGLPIRVNPVSRANMANVRKGIVRIKSEWQQQ